MRRFLATLGCLSLLTAAAAAESATEQLQSTIDRVFEVLRNPQLQGAENQTERRQQMRTIIADRFDYVEISMRALGRTWRQVTPDERRDFVPLFRELLEDTYLGHIDSDNGATVTYGRVRELRPGQVEVETTIVVDDKEIPVAYNMKETDGKWLVYDVKVEGIGLVKNYRTQFDAIVHKRKFAGLMEDLREKRVSADD